MIRVGKNLGLITGGYFQMSFSPFQSTHLYISFTLAMFVIQPHPYHQTLNSSTLQLFDNKVNIRGGKARINIDEVPFNAQNVNFNVSHFKNLIFVLMIK